MQWQARLSASILLTSKSMCSLEMAAFCSHFFAYACYLSGIPALVSNMDTFIGVSGAFRYNAPICPFETTCEKL